MAPNDVTEANEQQVMERLYPPKPKKFTFKLNIGDYVRISTSRTPFKKGYVGSWSEEIFRVSSLYPTSPPTYGIQDLNQKDIKGRFYFQELQSIKKPEEYRVEKVLRTRIRGGKTEYFVKWLNYSDSFNSWTHDIRKL
jgi:hypothetical protein